MNATPFWSICKTKLDVTNLKDISNSNIILYDITILSFWADVRQVSQSNNNREDRIIMNCKQGRLRSIVAKLIEN